MKNSELKKKLENFVLDLNEKSRGVNEDGDTYKYRVIDHEKSVVVKKEFARGMSEPWFVIDKESKLITGIDVNPFIRIDEMDFYDYMRLCNLIAEYLNTPLEEREDEKRWYIKFSDYAYSYLNLNQINGKYLIENRELPRNFQTKFTRSEIAGWAGTKNDEVIDWIIKKFGEEVE